MSDEATPISHPPELPQPPHVPVVVGAPPSIEPSAGTIARIQVERARQHEAEGWTNTHDRVRNAKGELAKAAYCYEYYANDPAVTIVPDTWPWGTEGWKPKDRIRNLERAGALYLAERDRILAEQSPGDPSIMVTSFDPISRTTFTAGIPVALNHVRAGIRRVLAELDLIAGTD